jgi:hypothetical protein
LAIVINPTSKLLLARMVVLLNSPAKIVNRKTWVWVRPLRVQLAHVVTGSPQNSGDIGKHTSDKLRFWSEKRLYRVPPD